MKKISKFRKSYIKRLIFRIVIFIIMIGLCIFYPRTYEISKGINFIKAFSPLHLVWLIWMIDMILQLCRVPNYWPLGSQKFFGYRYIPSSKKTSNIIIKKQMKQLNKESITIAITWVLLITLIAALYLTKVISYKIVILCTTLFYVCDTICVVIWCPFRVFYMSNKCCTTCRIFNWDHFMMFSPLIVIPGIWTYSLVILSLIILIVWEICFATHPERFLERTNCALECQNCKDKLCGKIVGGN